MAATSHDPSDRERIAAAAVFAGGGDMGALCRAHDWAATPLGPVSSWSQSLRTMVGAVLNSQNPMLLFWGPELIQFYNDAFRPSLGYDTAEPYARHPQALGARGREFWTDVWSVVGPQIEGVMTRGHAVWFEDQYLPIARDGRLDDVWWTYSYSPVRDDDGTIGGTLVVCLETTDRVRTEQQLRHVAAELEERTAELERALAEAALVEEHATDARRRAELLQRLTAALSTTLGAEQVAAVVLEQGLPAFGAAGGGVVLLVGDDPHARELQVLRMIGFEREGAIGRQRYALASGRPGADAVLAGRPVLLPDRAAWESRYPDHWPTMLAGGFEAYVAFPLRFEGRPIGVLTLYYEGPRSFASEEIALLTAFAEQCAQALERARLYTAAEAARHDAESARAAAEEANQVKSAFLATMSHELRTPLNAIGGYVELLDMGIRGPVTELQRADLARIQASQRHLLGLINDVLNYAKLETGTVRYDVEELRVDDALRSAEGLVIPQVRAKDLAFTVAPCGPELHVRADAEKLRQILVNLLSNAVKFTPSGGAVTIDVAVEPDVVRLRVSDTGIGIPGDKLEAIFEPFVQVRGDLTRTAEGTGLGLAISRDLARGMGGDLTADSTLGTGSAFTLTLPRA